MKRLMYVACFVLIGAVSGLFAQTNPLTGAWQGEVHYPQGNGLRMVLLITEQNATLAAKVHISNQGPQTLMVDSISRSGQILNFEIKKLNGRFSGTITGDQIKGTFTHSGTDLPLTLVRTARPPAD